MTINIVFKNNYSIEVKCKEFSITRSNLDNSITGINIIEPTQNKLLYLDLNDIMLIYRKE